jgi:hypothetical protein
MIIRIAHDADQEEHSAPIIRIMKISVPFFSQPQQIFMIIRIAHDVDLKINKCRS